MSGKESAKGLNDRQARIASFFEQTFWTTGLLATNEAAAESLREDVSYIKKLWDNSTFREYLVTRGVNLSKENDGLLTAQQLLLANILLNSHDTRTIREKIGIVGVSSQQYHAWMRQPAFRDYMQQRAKDMFSAKDWEVFNALGDQAASGGDTAAMKLFFEMRGHYTPRMDVNVNLDSVLAQIVEVVSKHVATDVMRAISADIQKVLEGEPVDMKPVQQAIPAKSSPVPLAL